MTSTKTNRPRRDGLLSVVIRFAVTAELVQRDSQSVSQLDGSTYRAGITPLGFLHRALGQPRCICKLLHRHTFFGAEFFNVHRRSDPFTYNILPHFFVGVKRSD